MLEDNVGGFQDSQRALTRALLSSRLSGSALSGGSEHRTGLEAILRPIASVILANRHLGIALRVVASLLLGNSLNASDHDHAVGSMYPALIVTRRIGRHCQQRLFMRLDGERPRSDEADPDPYDLVLSEQKLEPNLLVSANESSLGLVSVDDPNGGQSSALPARSIDQLPSESPRNLLSRWQRMGDLPEFTNETSGMLTTFGIANDTFGAEIVSAGKLIILRHGESTWNDFNRFTGWEDPPLTKAGAKEALEAALNLIESEPDLKIDICYTSMLSRSIQTALVFLKRYLTFPSPTPLPEFRTRWRLNERHYGFLQGMEKSLAQDIIDEQLLKSWRNTFEGKPPPMDEFHPLYSRHPDRFAAFRQIEDWTNEDIVPEPLRSEDIPLTESLSDCRDRVGPLWEEELKPLLLDGKNVLLVGHANCLRAFISHIQNNIDDEDLVSLDVPNAVPLIYEFDDDGQVVASTNGLTVPPIEGYYLGAAIKEFIALDVNHDGTIDKSEMADVVECKVFEDDSDEIQEECGAQMLAGADGNSDGLVSFKEFRAWRRRQLEKAFTRELAEDEDGMDDVIEISTSSEDSGTVVEKDQRDEAGFSGDGSVVDVSPCD